jgi:signal peptidase I
MKFGRLMFLALIAVGVTALLRTFVVDVVSVASGSMAPTLDIGAHYLVNRLVFRFRDPRRGEIIVFTNPVDGKTGTIKRVIAVGGDTVERRDKKVYLNGQGIDEPYAVYKRAKDILEGDNLGPIQIPRESVFVLGDDRDESFDSATWKNAQTGARIYFLPMANIKGKLMQII